MDGGGRGVCYTTPTHTHSILSLFPLPEAGFGWDLDLLRDSAPRCPLPSLLRCLVGDAWAPLWTSLPLGLWGHGSFSPDAPLSSWNHPGDLPLIPTGQRLEIGSLSICS